MGMRVVTRLLRSGWTSRVPCPDQFAAFLGDGVRVVVVDRPEEEPALDRLDDVAVADAQEPERGLGEVDADQRDANGTDARQHIGGAAESERGLAVAHGEIDGGIARQLVAVGVGEAGQHGDPIVMAELDAADAELVAGNGIDRRGQRRRDLDVVLVVNAAGVGEIAMEFQAELGLIAGGGDAAGDDAEGHGVEHGLEMAAHLVVGRQLDALPIGLDRQVGHLGLFQDLAEPGESRRLVGRRDRCVEGVIGRCRGVVVVLLARMDGGKL